MKQKLPSRGTLLKLIERSLDEGRDKEVIERLQWFLHYSTHGSVSKTCKEFGIARSTFYRWINRFDINDFSKLTDRPTHNRKPLLGSRLAFLIALLLINLGVLIFAIPTLASAASSWNPTLLVSTEAFERIDDSDTASDVYLEFGETLQERLIFRRDENIFTTSRGLRVGGNLTATGSISATGAITTSGALKVDGTSTLQGAVTFGDGSTNFTFPTTRGSSGNILKLDASGTATWYVDDDTPESGDFGNAGDLDADGTITDGVIDEADLDAADSASDEDILTFEGTGFEWHSAAEMGIGTATSITDGLIVEPDLDADVAAADGDFLQYDSTGTNFTWRSAAETLSDIGAQATVTEGSLTDDVIVEGDLKAVDAAADEDFLTYESTTGDFEWHSIADVSAGIAADIAEGELANDIIVEADLKAVDAASDEDIFTFESTTGDFEWHSAADLGIGTATAIQDGLIVEPDLDADNAAADGDWLQYDSTGTNFVWRSSAELLSDVGQNAGTDITADLEEETHASEHASGGGDAVDHDTLTNFAANEHIDWTGATNNLKTTGSISGTTLNVDKNAFIFSKLAVSGAIATDSNLSASGTLSVEGNVTTSGTMIVQGATNIKGALTLGDGTTKFTLPTSDGTNNQVLQTDGAGTVSWGSAAGGGDSVSIDGVGVTDPDFVSTGDIDFVDTSNTVTANINAGSIIETDLDGDVAPADGDFLQYDSTGTNFTWRSAAETLSDIGAEATVTEGSLANDVIVEADLKAVDAASDEDILTFETTTGDFEWHSKSDLGIGTATAIQDGLIIEPDLDADNAAADGDWLQYDSTGTNFVWRSSAELLSDLGQNAGTNITADLEEETHASEHASGGGDAVDHDTLTNFAANEHIDWTGATNNLKTTGSISGTTLNVDKNAFFFGKINASGAVSTEGNLAASGTLSVEGAASFQNATDSTTGFQIFDADGGTPILNVDTTNERVGIGTAAPATALQITDATGTWKIGGGDLNYGGQLDIVGGGRVEVQPLAGNQFKVASTSTATVSTFEGNQASTSVNIENDTTASTDNIALFNFKLLTSAQSRTAGAIGASWTNITDATRIGMLEFKTTNGSSSYATRMVINGDKVGIGTTTPDAKLDVKGTMSGQRLVVAPDIASETGALFVDMDLNATGALIDSEATNAPVLALDTVATPAQVADAPHILFGYRGKLDVKMYRSGTGALRVASVSGTTLAVDTESSTATDIAFKIVSDNSSDENTVFKVQADGKTFADGAYSGGGADYAEWFPTHGENLQPGNPVCIDIENDGSVKSCTGELSDIFVGVISTNPGFIGGHTDKLKSGTWALVGLVGQVMVDVSDETGLIKRGDVLTPSETPGVARKATPWDKNHKGIALIAIENQEEPRDKIKVLLK